MTQIIAGPSMPVVETADLIAGSAAIPVYVEDESAPTSLIDGGPAVPVYSVTQEDIAAGRFTVSAGPARRVTISRSTSRRQLAGPAIPVRRVGGPGYFGNLWLDQMKTTFGSDLLAVYTGSEPSGTVMLDSSGNARHGVYSGTTPGILNTATQTQSRRFDSLTDGARWHSASLEAAWSWSAYTLLAYARVNSAGVWSDGTTRHIIRVVNTGLGIISQIKKHTTASQIQWECNVNGSNTNVTLSLGGTLGWFAVALTFSDADNRARFYAARRGVPATLVAERAQASSPSGALSPDRCTVGCSNYSTLVDLFDGDIFPAAIVKREASIAELATLMNLVV